ncbi:MAG: hypothetical protein IJU38_07125 [Clostridia bacterium]|nr:hypothetical protein [Clostridia bacterium]
MKNQMTVQKELFVQGLLAGKNQTEAYLFAFPEEKKKNKRTIQNKASLMAKRPEIVARLDELRAGTRQETEITLTQFILDLQKVALAQINPLALKPGDKLRAMELLAKVLGFDQSAASPEYEDTSVIDRQVLAYTGPDHDSSDTAD